jgi:ArsR family transcriptional regulator
MKKVSKKSPPCPPGAKPIVSAGDPPEAVVDMLKALAHPVRLKMFDVLRRSKKVCARDFEEFFNIKQPTVSHHLKILKDADIILAEPKGVWTYYSLRKEALKDLTGFFR